MWSTHTVPFLCMVTKHCTKVDKRITYRRAQTIFHSQYFWSLSSFVSLNILITWHRREFQFWSFVDTVRRHDYHDHADQARNKSKTAYRDKTIWYSYNIGREQRADVCKCTSSMRIELTSRRSRWCLVSMINNSKHPPAQMTVTLRMKNGRSSTSEIYPAIVCPCNSTP